MAIDFFDCFYFGGTIAFVGRLVGGLDVYAHQVNLFQGTDRIAALGGVVGVGVAGRPGHFDPPPTDQRRQAAQQVDGGDHRALRSVSCR